MCRPLSGVLVGLLVFAAADSASSLSAENSDSARQRATGEAVDRLLEVGFDDRPDSLRSARRIWKQARLRSRGDVRVDYAWGLVLRRHSRNEEAERRFLSAANRAKPAYIPARQAVVWLKLARGDYAQGLVQLEHLLRDLTGGTAKRDPAARKAGARWVGRVLAALEKVPLSKRDESKRAATMRRAEQLLTGTLRTAYDAGRKDVVKISERLEGERLKTRISAQEKQNQQEKAQRKDIASKKQSIDQRQSSLNLTAEQWKEWLEKRRKTANVSLQKQVKELNLLQQRRRAIARSLSLAQQQRAKLLTIMQAASRRSRTPPLPAGRRRAADVTLARVQKDILNYQTRSLATLQQMQGVRAQAAAVIRQYRAAVKKYESATGKIARKNATLNRWEKHLKQQERELNNSGKLTPAEQRMELRLKRFSTYIEFDLKAEKQRLLNSFPK